MHTRCPGPATGHHFGCKAIQGFTLIELLVAVSIMAVMAVMAWRALDGMQGASTQSRSHTDAVLTLDAGLAQWVADLDNMQELPHTTPLDWNGRALRITRRDNSDPAQGLLVVAWTRNPRTQGNPGIASDQWLRWQSAPLRTRQAWQAAWRSADLWVQNQGADKPNTTEPSREVAIAPLQQWQIYYFRGGAWSNALSSAGTPDASATQNPNASVPDGVRLGLTLAAPHPLAGVLTRDWARATHTGAAP
jgi:general secretion pathway protein J